MYDVREDGVDLDVGEQVQGTQLLRIGAVEVDRVAEAFGELVGQ